MKICYFVSEYPAVSHTFIRREIVQLEQDGFEVLRVSLRRNARDLVDPADLEEVARTRYLLNGHYLDFARALGAAVMRRPRQFFAAARAAIAMMKRSHRPMVFHLIYLAEALLLSKWLLEGQVRHIHAHFGTNGAEVAMLTHLLTDIPYSFTVHGPDEFDRPEYLGLSEKVRHASFVCAISSFTRSQICRWIPPAQWSKVKLIRCGLDAGFTTWRLPTKLSPNHLVCIGRLCEQKGQIVLLEALAILSEQGVSCCVTLAGDGPLRPALQQRIRELGLVDRVEMPGWLTNSEVQERILRARAFVLPSFAEGLPVVLMEALSLGRPVITTYVAGIPELIGDGVCGWIVPAAGAEELARAMRNCLEASESQILAMGQAGRARVLKMHDIGDVCRELGALFRSGGAALPVGGEQAIAAERIAAS